MGPMLTSVILHVLADGRTRTSAEVAKVVGVSKGSAGAILRGLRAKGRVLSFPAPPTPRTPGRGPTGPLWRSNPNP